MINANMYREYLIKLKNKMYKALCLYEEQSETFEQYFGSLIFVELTGLQYWIKDLPHDVWYVETLSRLKSLHDGHREDIITTKTMKSELFGIMKMIDKQIDEMKG